MNCLAILHDSLPTEIKKTLDTPLDSMVRDSNRLVLRIAYYPLNNDTYAAYDLAAPHEDINLITLLPSTTELGLQIFEPLAGWKDVICGSNDLIVIAGDMLEECTRSLSGFLLNILIFNVFLERMKNVKTIDFNRLINLRPTDS
jgi:hypothetical protein